MQTTNVVPASSDQSFLALGSGKPMVNLDPMAGLTNEQYFPECGLRMFCTVAKQALWGGLVKWGSQRLSRFRDHRRARPLSHSP